MGDAELEQPQHSQDLPKMRNSKSKWGTQRSRMKEGMFSAAKALGDNEVPALRTRRARSKEEALAEVEAAQKAVEDLKSAQAASSGMVVDSSSVPEHHGVPFTIAQYMEDPREAGRWGTEKAEEDQELTHPSRRSKGSKMSDAGTVSHDWTRRLLPGDADAVFAAGFGSASALHTAAGQGPTEEQAKALLLRRGLPSSDHGRANGLGSAGMMSEAMFLEQRLTVRAKEKDLCDARRRLRYLEEELVIDGHRRRLALDPPAEPIYLPGRVGKHRCSFLIDTGARRSGILSSCALRFGLKMVADVGGE